MAAIKKGTRVQYRTRWDRQMLRSGTVGRVGMHTIWIGCHCFHHDDLVAVREVE